MKKSIHICNHCRVDDFDCDINRGDEVEWISDDKTALSIDFIKSPFSQTHFDVPADGTSVASGAASTAGKFRYNVARMDASMAADPNIIVH
jgi:hypothetical protein